jgi:cell division protein FtsN
LEDAENKVKKTKRFSYAALGFGAVALSAAAGLGVMAYSAKSEVSKLTEQVSTLEASLAKNIDNNPNEEINALMNSVVQLNQQVYGFITQIKETPQFPIDLLNNKVSDIVVKQDMVSKALDMLQAKIGGEEEKIAFKPLVNEPVKLEPVTAKEEQVHEIAPAKAEASHEHAPARTEAVKEAAPGHAATKDQAVHEVVAPVKEKAKQEAAPAKQEVTPAKVEAAPKSVPAKAKIQPEAAPAKPIALPQVVVKEEAVKANQQGASAGKWGINLVAFKQEWFAKSKAAEFARLGVFAEVIPVHERNSTMYRLRVGGFKSKAEAFSNTDRIKKTLNLDSVWVSDN